VYLSSKPGQSEASRELVQRYAARRAQEARQRSEQEVQRRKDERAA
jgi:hypothetical protein